MLPFTPIAMRDKELLNRCFDKFPYENSELSFPDLYMWRDSWRIGICSLEDTVYLFEENLAKPSVFLPVLPMRESLPQAVERAIEHIREIGLPFRMRSVNESYRDWVEREMPGRFTFEPDGDFFDYVYETRSIIDLAGKKMHAKRNYMNKFRMDYGSRFTYERLEGGDKENCMALYDEWLVGRDPAERESLRDERTAIARTFDEWADIGMIGGKILIDGRVRAFTFGERRKNDMAIIHIEKADADIPGLYVAIGQQFAENELSDIRWINREEDMGLEGLRRAKRSWHPARMVTKYIMKLADAEA